MGERVPDDGYNSQSCYHCGSDGEPEGLSGTWQCDACLDKQARLAALTREQAEAIRELLNHLPDGDGTDSLTWGWCWNELDCDGQDAVKAVRAKAAALLRPAEGSD